MPIYSCPRCGYSSHIKTYLRKHFLRKFPCKSVLTNCSTAECFQQVLGETIQKSNKVPEKSLKNPEKSLKKCVGSLKNPEKITDGRVESAAVVSNNQRPKNAKSLKRKKRVQSHKLTSGKSVQSDITKSSSLKKVRAQRKKKFQCSKCAKCFTRKDNLSVHQRKFCKGDSGTQEVFIPVSCFPYEDSSPVMTDEESGDDSESGTVSQESIKQENLLLKKENKLLKHAHRIIEKEKKTIERQKKLIQQERDTLKKEIETMLVATASCAQTIQNVHMTQNIIINNYGHENIEYLSQSYLTNLLKIPYNSIQKLLKAMHFHPQHPENHNVKIPNKKEKFAIIYDNGKWYYKNKRDVIESLVNKSYNILDNHFDANKVALEDTNQYQFLEFQDKYEKDNKVKKQIHKETELEILNSQEVMIV